MHNRGICVVTFKGSLLFSNETWSLLILLGPYGPGPHGLPWALTGRALMGPLGPYGPRPYGPPCALMGRALMGFPWAPMGQALMGSSGLLWAGPYGPGPNGPGVYI